MVDFEPKLDRDKDGNLVAYGIQFRDAKPHTTLSFLLGKSVHMYVYVDKDRLPLAMALVFPTRAEMRSGEQLA